jgi:transposase
LTDEDIAAILDMRKEGWKATQIAEEMGRNESTVRSFLAKFDKTGMFHGTIGRPLKLISGLNQRVVADVSSDPHLSVRSETGALKAFNDAFSVSRETVRKIRHEQGYHYYDTIPMPGLGPITRANRVEFCRRYLADPNPLPIVFTDESMICQNLKRGGIWRRRGVYLPEGVYIKQAHEVSVMVWGGISKDFRTWILQCPDSVNAISYAQMLADGRVFYMCITKFGPDGFIWQQDNAPAHGPLREVISERFKVLDWPAHSPDLSPIEMVWSWIKRELAGKEFANPNQLFAAIQQVWGTIEPEKIDNLVGSFRARCQVCLNLDGACLNGHWNEVHREHHKNDPTVPETATEITEGIDEEEAVVGETE